MNKSSPHSKVEQKAHQLWEQFDRDHQEAFWQRYEPLIEQHTAQVVYLAPQQIAQTTRAIAPQTFHYLIFPYRVRLIAFLAVIGAGCFFSFQIYNSSEVVESFIHFMLLLGLLFLANYLWVFSMYDINDQGLIITRNLSLNKAYFAWKEIQEVKIYKNGFSNDADAHLNILLKTNEIYYFKYPLFEHDHLIFLKALKQKQIGIDSKI